MPKSYNNDFGRPKGRPGPIVNVCGSEKDGKRVLQKSMRKKGAEKRHPKSQIKRTLGRPRGVFGAGGGVRRGQAPPGPAISASIQFSIKNALHPAGCGGYFFMKNGPVGPQGSIYSAF